MVMVSNYFILAFSSSSLTELSSFSQFAFAYNPSSYWKLIFVGFAIGSAGEFRRNNRSRRVGSCSVLTLPLFPPRRKFPRLHLRLRQLPSIGSRRSLWSYRRGSSIRRSTGSRIPDRHPEHHPDRLPRGSYLPLLSSLCQGIQGESIPPRSSLPSTLFLTVLSRRLLPLFQYGFIFAACVCFAEAAIVLAFFQTPPPALEDAPDDRDVSGDLPKESL